jgi:hypothetical protein
VSVAREAIYLPLLFLTVTLLGGMQSGRSVSFTPPPVFALVLAMLLLGLLVRSGAFAPDRLMNATRPVLANLNGLSVLVTLFAATAQAFHLATPRYGLPLLLFDTYLFVLLLNTLAAAPDRPRVLRSLMVVFGSAFILKFVILAALSDPAASTIGRVLQVLLEGVTLGTLTQEAMHPASGYVAFFTFVLYLAGVAALPGRSPRAEGRGVSVHQHSSCVRTTSGATISSSSQFPERTLDLTETPPDA